MTTDETGFNEPSLFKRGILAAQVVAILAVVSILAIRVMVPFEVAAVETALAEPAAAPGFDLGLAFQPMISSAHAGNESIAQPRAVSAPVRPVGYFPDAYELKAEKIEPPIAQF
jgi:hypothetical protein